MPMGTKREQSHQPMGHKREQKHQPMGEKRDQHEKHRKHYGGAKEEKHDGN